MKRNPPVRPVQPVEGRKKEYGGIGVDVVELGEAGVPLAWLQVRIAQPNETRRQPLVAATSYNWFLLL